MSNYKKGQIIKGQVTGIEKYGVFINIDAYYNGLIHISEVSDSFVRNINDYFNMGETISAKIIEIDEDNMQLKLSIKGINYRNNKNVGKVKESKNGFTPLKDKLVIWIKEKLEK